MGNKIGRSKGVSDKDNLGDNQARKSVFRKRRRPNKKTSTSPIADFPTLITQNRPSIAGDSEKKSETNTDTNATLTTPQILLRKLSSKKRSLSQRHINSVLAEDQVIKKGGEPRVIFVSLWALQLHWTAIEINVLENAIFIFAAKQRWMFPRCESDRKEAIRCWPLSQFPFTTIFQAMIDTKQEQGSVMWALDALDDDTPALSPPIRGTYSNTYISRNDSCNTLSLVQTSILSSSNCNPKNGSRIDVRWRYLSRQLTTFIDTVSGQFYNPLLLSQQYWRQSNPANNDYCFEISTICDELNHFNCHFAAAIEIIKRSNPNCIPMVAWNANQYSVESLKIANQTNNVSLFTEDDASADATDDEWFRAEDLGDTTDCNGFVYF